MTRENQGCVKAAATRIQQSAGFGALVLAAASLLVPAFAARAADPWPPIKVSTREAGLHHVTATSLAALVGATTNDVRDRILQGRWLLLNRGQPGRWLAGSDGGDLVFYAEALRNNYTSANVYWLVEGTNPPPATADGGSPAAVGNAWYLAATNCEQDLYCRYELGTHPDSNYWFWANAVAGHPLRGKFDVAVPLDAVGDTSALARLTVRLCGASTLTNGVAVSVNGTTNAAWVGWWPGKVPAVFTFDVPASLLKAGNNTIRFTAVGATLTQWWLDGFVLQFPRPYAAVAGALQCAANSNAVVTLTGFSDARITVLDVSQPLAPVQVTNVLVEPYAGQWRASFAPGSGAARYSVAQAGSLLEPSALQAVWPLNLSSPTNRAACVIIAPATLQLSAAALAGYRNAQGLETRVVPLEAVYDEFNGGIREPEAVRTFLAQAHRLWQLPPAYSVLAGNGTYDYRNLLGKNDNLLPPLMLPTRNGLAASDSDFGNLGGYDAPQIAVGRLPAVSAGQLDAMIGKIQSYEAQPPAAGNHALLVADSFADPLAGDFPTETLAVQSLLTPAFQTTAVLPSTVVQMHNQVLASLTAGADLMCYLGHGASTQFGAGSPGYLANADLSTLSNSARLPLIVGITCLAGSFAEPGGDCLAESFVTASRSGAIAFVAASGFSVDAEAVTLNWALMTSLSGGASGRLGDQLRGAMASYNLAPHWTPSGLFNLMGDPALRLHSTPLPPPVISALTFTPDRECQITLSATPGQNYTLLATTNLGQPQASWSIVSSGVVPSSPFVLLDPAATNSPHRFYRLRFP